MSALLACSLPGPELQEQLATIAELARRALRSYEQDGETLRLQYSSDAAGELERLVARERECCAFLDFDLVHGPDAIYLTITAPKGASEFASVLSRHFLGKAAPQVAGCSSSCGCGVAA